MAERYNQRRGVFETLDVDGNVISERQPGPNEFGTATGEPSHPIEAPAAVPTGVTPPAAPPAAPSGFGSGDVAILAPTFNELGTRLSEGLQQRAQGVITNPVTGGVPAMLLDPWGATGIGIRRERPATATAAPAAAASVPPLEMTPIEHAPGMEEVLALLRPLLDQGGGGNAGAAPEPTGTPGSRAAEDLANATAFEGLNLPEPDQGDPGLRVIRDMFQRRQERLDPVIQQLVAETQGQLDTRTNRTPQQTALYNIGLFLGRLASGERGPVGQRMIDDRVAREQALQERILRLTEAGFGLDEARARAEADIASSGYQAGIQREERDYSRGVQARQLGQGDRQLGATLALALANLMQQDQAQVQALNQQGEQALLSTPGLESVGGRAAGARMFGNNPELASRFAGSVAQRARLAPVLNAMIAGLDRGDLRQARRDAERAARGLNLQLSPSDLDLLVRQQAQLRAGAAAQ